MLGITALFAALYLGFAFAIAPIPTLETGRCVNGLHEGSGASTAATRSVDCAKPHDNEVVGSVRYLGDGAYPGRAALVSFAQTQCGEAFGTYVGVDFQSSSLEMFIAMPSDLTWAKGDRQIGCVVLAGDDTMLTGSVKGTAR